ncbi:MAG: hypothetical protein AB8B55_01285 [Mariniblastus sp.]
MKTLNTFLAGLVLVCFAMPTMAQDTEKATENSTPVLKIALRTRSATPLRMSNLVSTGNRLPGKWLVVTATR